MATPQEFMEQVVAWPGPDGPGYVNIHWAPAKPNHPNDFRGKPYKEIHEFMNFAQYAATKPGTYKEIYFCLSTQAATGRLVHGHPVAARLKQNVLRLKAIWLDVDVKKDKGYATIPEALDGIKSFVVAAQLPPPSALVLSGGGVHVYWISDKPLVLAEWRPYAEGLKAEALRLGLKCDAGITADAARILRVPGTYNNKLPTPRPVRVAHLGANYDFSTSLTRLASAGLTAMPAGIHVTGPVMGPRTLVPFDLKAFAGQRMASAFSVLDVAHDSLSAGLNTRSDLPLDAKEVLRGCHHYHESLRTGGKGQGQGLWMLTVLGTTWFENGRKIAHALSDQYPSYTPEETDRMYDRKLTERTQGNIGWPACATFEGEGAKCKACPFYGKLKSPLHLANRVVAPQTPIVSAAPPPEELDLPPGFTVNPDTDIICEIVQKTLQGGALVDEYEPLFMSKIRKPVLQRGLRKIRFETSLDDGTWGDVGFLESELASDQRLLIALREAGVKTYVPNERRLRHFMTSWTAALDAAKARIDTVSFGWLRKDGELPRPEIGFAYGGRVIMKDGSNRPAGYADTQLELNYKPKGNPALWLDALHMVTEQHYPALEVPIAASFAAPLLFATGKYNGTICPWSPAGGTHKSTSIAIGASVWGCPKLTKERPLSSNKGIIHKMSEIKNLPVYWDEINSNEKMEQVVTILGSATEGGGGTLLFQNRTIRPMDEWQTLMIVGANKSLIEAIRNGNKGTDSQLQRVFEFEVEKRPDTRIESDVSRLISDLDYNYGHMGLRYSELLGRDPVGIYNFVEKTEKEFCAEVDQDSKERFRSSMAATCYAGAVLANQIGCDFNLAEIREFLKQEYLRQRDVIVAADMVGNTNISTLNTLSQFFKANTRNTLWVNELPVKRAGKPAITHIAGPNRDHPDPVHVRCAVSDRVIDLSKRRFETYLHVNKYDVGPTVTNVCRHLGATIVQKVDLSYGAQVMGGRETIIRIPVPNGSALEADLYKHRTADEEVTATVTSDQGALALAAETGEADLAVVRGQS